ncbi:transglycosylase SLT domain-containing protein [uncultured Helicobacter sp.]|uniref:lytic transglycosylase domain-containing protein n=1 Tax=uncultured Helicobacter sp. TaxID=175537 RepID=UPI0027DADEE7|nr:transglycosylase SLT domain-containing protein [uncultured Helicobacter sp.]
MKQKIFLLTSLIFLSTARADSGGFNIDNFNVSTLHSFGIGVEFLPKLKTSTILYADNTNTRWAYFVNQFDSSYEFIPIIRSMIAQAGIPQEFLFLAMVESGFSARAYSKKKAVGIWQLMPFTAKDLGLQINDYIDERRDPIRSTQAAIKYLQYLYNSTGEWYLAAMAYNCGLGRLQKAIAKAGSSDLEVLLDEEKKYLPSETRQYIRSILSMSLAFNDVRKLQGVDREYLLNRGAMDTLVEVPIRGGTLLANIAVGAGMSLEDLKKYNRHIIYNFLPPNAREYAVYIPYERLAYFKQNFDANVIPKSVFVLHTVKKGESLASIAKYYKITIQEIKLTNSLHKPLIFANQKLVIPIIRKDSQKLAQK